MRSITMNAENLYMNYPESISIKRNPNGTYNLYALIKLNYIENEEPIDALLGLKSEGLHLQRDFDMSISISETQTTACQFPISYIKEILYNLQFSKSIDALVQYEILNKGEGLMNYNVYESLENYTVQVNVVGFVKEELDVILDDGLIRVSAKPATQLAIDDEECLMKNFDKAKAECEIYLPNIESVEAELKNGILYLNIPKISKGERISIKSA